MLEDINISQMFINGVGVFLAYVGRKVLTYIRDQRVKDEAFKIGMASLLCYHLIKSAQIACKRGWISAKHLDNIKKMYTAHHLSGGDGEATIWYEQAIKLPVREE